MNHFYSYLAGLIDADGSLYVRLKKNQTHRFDYQVVPSVVIFQHEKHKRSLESIHNKLKLGRIRKRNDHMLELVVSKHNEIEQLVVKILPFLIIKKERAVLLLQIMKELSLVTSPEEFVELAGKIDSLSSLNFSVNRKINARVIGDHLKKLGLLTP